MMTQDQIVDLMSNANTIAVIGISDDVTAPSYEVAAYQQSQGYKLIPISDDHDSILGRKVVPSLNDVTEPVDIVNVFVRSDNAPPIEQAAKTLGVKAIWLQPGTSPVVENKLRDSGIPVVSGKCFKREHQRLLAKAQI